MLTRGLVLPLNLAYKHLNNPDELLQWGFRDERVIQHIAGLDHAIFPLFTERGDLVIHSGERELRVLRDWCRAQFGRRGARLRSRAWNHVAGVFAFRESHDAFAFKMRWAGVTPE